MNYFMDVLLHAALYFTLGCMFAFVMPKKAIPRALAEGKITSKQAALSTKIAKVNGTVIMGLAVFYFIYFGIIRSF